MPTSTPWRSRQSGDSIRATSPTRPVDDAIEQLSPDLFLSSRTSPYNSSKHSTREPTLLGLGLSGPSNSNNFFSIAQPDHIYFDSDGGAHVGAKVRSSSRYAQLSGARIRGGRNNEARSSRDGSKQNKNKGHTRSGSTIDDLANVAIATSPSFDNESPTFPFSGKSPSAGASRPATSYMDGYSSESRHRDRPAKRVRSEKLHSMEWTPTDERPRTSHVQQAQTSMEEAELLLGLRNGYSFSTNTSPVFASASTFQPPAAADLIQPPLSEDVTAVPQLEHSLDNTDEALFSEVRDVQSEQQKQEEPDNITERMDVDPSPVETQEEHVATTEGGNPVQESSQNDTQPIENPEPVLSEVGEVPEAPEKPATPPPATTVARSVPIAKKPRKIKPEIQAEVCAACQKLQRENAGEDTTTQWICCDYCGKWLHFACGGFKDKADARSVDKFVCKDCEPQHGQTTFVRKSSRVRTAIDYAGLNQGVVKSSEESSMHHYIQPIKDRTIKYLDDDFARIRPELLTAEFWENMDNMKRPFVIPACWNPRFGILNEHEASEQDTIDAAPLSEPSFVTFDAHGIEVDKSSKLESNGNGSVSEDLDKVTVVDCDQDYLDMVMPRNLTVRKVAELYGPDQPVPVIDVKSQETKGQWTLNEWADYYEQQGEKPIRNVISLEVSNSPIGKLIRRPKAVRDIDLEDHVWDNETRTTSNKRPVQFYCLMSVADSYTDFHIDFGGSSVYYHILKGVKTFFFIPPEEKNLKEYEKWCNSDTQNDTWLGDLCNGNVTRVDLHEGDTAFIPAGWIHSVWTPKDSLVIGGNFLTKLDYELQLRVANIEKVTKVPQKFRYPFFQKVMWYALLKYLDEDPVPEEVLRDFHSDEDYLFLRANPVWHEYGELSSDAEPGEPGYNARVYPKSEIRGLPSLRDYLYRTACIHADIPVADINKKQIDAVKASIPKGYGDPMRLIKTFAVWCAWKSGNEAVPRWVHDQGDGLVSEIKEREKLKEEIFRVPPERVSARNASKAKATSPAVEVQGTPAKSAPVIDGNDNSSTKSRSGSRGGSLRVACEACRKRRIKCRHKDGDDAAANSSPPEIRPRTYSNVSVDVPKLASASPVSSSFDQGPVLNMMTEFGNTSDLAQAALATLHSQSSDPNQAVVTTPNGGSAKKGRSKACEECRKSKRRCVHDEYGRIDPAKAAEPSKPRGSTNTKRQPRLSDESSAKRHKVEEDVEFQLADLNNTSDIDMLIDPALMGDGFSINAIHAPTESIVTQEEPNSDPTQSSVPPLPLLEQTEESDVMAMEFDNLSADIHLLYPIREELRTQLHVDVPTNSRGELSNIPAHMRQSPDVDISYSPITVDGNVAESTEKPDIKMDDVEALSAKPEQPRQANGKTVEVQRSSSKPVAKEDSLRRASTTSDHTLDPSVKSRRSSSNTSGTTHQVASVNAKGTPHQDASARPASRTSRASSIGSDVGADERFARELQAAENGLRRRASMRA